MATRTRRPQSRLQRARAWAKYFAAFILALAIWGAAINIVTPYLGDARGTVFVVSFLLVLLAVREYGKRTLSV